MLRSKRVKRFFLSSVNHYETGNHARKSKSRGVTIIRGQVNFFILGCYGLFLKNSLKDI